MASDGTRLSDFVRVREVAPDGIVIEARSDTSRHFGTEGRMRVRGDEVVRLAEFLATADLEAVGDGR